MIDKKIFLASGCSFTFEPWNWPSFVSEKMNYNLINVGMASQGNGLIGKKIIYNVDKLLKKYNSEDIIVGVMWSGIDRNDFHTDDSSRMSNVNGWIENPTHIVDGHKNWEITNYMWETKKSKLWYEYFHTHVGSIIQTIQNILMVQWYLEKNNVKYFMTTYMNIFGDPHIKHLITTPEVEYLYKMIDFNRFIPIKGCYEWVKENYNEEGMPGVDKYGNHGIHPTEFGHIKFANEVVVPFVKENIS